MTDAAPNDIVLVLTTLDAGADANAFARTLIDERLAACVSILPGVRSIYRWKEAVEEAAEHQLVIKTTASRLDLLKMRLAQLHPYDVPEVLVVPVNGGADPYLAWLRESVG